MGSTITIHGVKQVSIWKLQLSDFFTLNIEVQDDSANKTRIELYSPHDDTGMNINITPIIQNVKLENTREIKIEDK